MNQRARHLDQIQRWMQSVISYPSGVLDGIASPAAQSEIPVSPEELESVITRSSQLTALERIEVYAHAYYARLLDCLSEEFPALVTAMGETAFGAFCMEYLQEYPSTSYTLGELGGRFPQFLAENKPNQKQDGESKPDWTDFLVEVATLERVYSEVFDGPGIEQTPLLTPETLNAVPIETWPQLSLKVAPCFRLLKFQFPVHEYITQVRQGKTPSMPEPETVFLAITRRNFIVRREAVSQAEFVLLSQLQQGQQVGDAIAELVESNLIDQEKLAVHLHQWFRHWTEAAFFVGFNSE